MPQAIPSMPKSAEDMAFFEMGGVRYLVLPLGPVSAVAGTVPRAVQMPSVPVPASVKGAVTDVVPPSEPENSAPKRYVYGLKGIQSIFNCSKSSAYNIKRSGRIDGAISQIGNTIVVDVEKALELLKK